MRVDKGRRRRQIPTKKPARVDPILEAWKGANPGRPVPPDLLTDPRESTVAEAREHRSADWSDTWA